MAVDGENGEDAMLVKEVMSTKIEAVAPTTTARECAGTMHQMGVSILPVWQDGKPVGLVTDRDICCRVVGAPARILQGRRHGKS